MRIQIFQHLPTLPKAGIFCPLPILCVAFRTFIPDRSVFRCSLSPVFLCSVPSSRCINPHTLSRTQPLPRATLLPHPSPHPPLHSTPAYQHPPPRFQHRPPDASAKGQHAHSRRCTATAPRSRTHTPHTNSQHTPTHRHPPSHFRTGHQTPAPGTAHPPRCYTATTPPHQSSQQIGASALAIIIQPHPPHTQASKKDCPAQEQSFL